MSVPTEKMKAVFLAVLEKSTAAERAALLDDACAGDATLRHSVEALLWAHDQADPLLDLPAADHLDKESTVRDGAPDLLGFLDPPSRPGAIGRIGHYEVHEILGRGGFSIVFRAVDDVLQRVVAIKVLAPHLAVTSPARKRFLREARAAAMIRHENVVQVHAVEEQPLPYLVMEFIPGETLQQRIDRTGPLEPVEVLHLGRQIADGRAAAHALGLVHRDIKPANILIEYGPKPRVKITDFGLARTADDASLTQSGIVSGTPMFMAPEQARGGSIDHRADLFSLGSVLYMMCSGRPPFRASSTLAVLKRVAEDTPRPLPEVIPEVPKSLCDLITRLHAKKPEDRCSSAREVAVLLGRDLAALRQSAYDHTTPEAAPTLEFVLAIPTTAVPAAASRRRGRIGRWAAAAAVLLALLVGVGVTEATGVTTVRGTVIRLFSPSGTLVVEVDDPGISFRIEGSDMVITGAGAKEIRLPVGTYSVEARKDGKLVQRELVSVTKEGRPVVRVLLEQSLETKDPDRRAAEYVLSIDGKVRVNGEERDLDKAADLPREPFRLTGIVLDHNEQVRARVTDAGLAHFAGCKHLTYLALAHTPVGDEGVAHFKDCKAITHLQLPGVRVSDAGLAHFAGCKDLTHLSLAHTKNVYGDGLAAFAGCKNLLRLNLAETNVTDAGLSHFGGCKNLTHLDLGRTGVSDAGVAYFADSKNLCALNLTETKVSDKSLAHFKDAKNLTWLILSGCTEVSDAGLAHFADCKSLGWLILDRSKVTDAGLAHFEGCKGLSIVVLNNTGVTDASVGKLADRVNLSQLLVHQTRVTRTVIDDLKTSLPKCRIHWDGGVIEPR
jgi:uncharacterized membrane protein